MRLLRMLGKMGVLIPSAPVCALGQLPLVSKGSLCASPEAPGHLRRIVTGGNPPVFPGILIELVGANAHIGPQVADLHLCTKLPRSFQCRSLRGQFSCPGKKIDKKPAQGALPKSRPLENPPAALTDCFRMFRFAIGGFQEYAPHSKALARKKLFCRDVTKNCGKLFPFRPCYHRKNIV